MSRIIFRDLKLMIGFSALRNISDLFMGTFFLSFVMHSVANEILAVSMYKLFEYVATMLGFVLIANLCKKYDKVSVFGMNLVLKAVLLLLIIFLGDAAADFIVPLGLLYGFGAALYHLPMHTMVGEKVASSSMARYMGVKNAVNFMAKVFMPVVLGIFITVSSYTQMAYALLFLTGIEVFMVMGLTRSRHRAKTAVDFRGFARCVMRFPIIKQLFLIEVLRGFSTSGALGTVITMYTVFMFHTDMNLGIFTTIFSFCSIITSFVFSRFAKRNSFPRIILACTLTSIAAMSLFLVNTTPYTFLIYNFIYATAIATMVLICDINVYNLSQSRCVKNNHKIEYFVFRDGALFLGRWISYVILMYIGIFGDASWLRYYLAVVTVAILFAGLIAGRVSSHIRMR